MAASDRPLMPQATAIWLIENTALTFEQIAAFCDLHKLEVEGIANEDVAQGIRGIDPIAAGQTTRADLERCAGDPGERLKMAPIKEDLPELKRRRGPRYTPVSRRRDRPDAIAWLLRNHPELKDSQIGKLVGTTKSTIVRVRDRSHWNAVNIKPVDPVALGLCRQIELDALIARVAKSRPPQEEKTSLRLETAESPELAAEEQPADKKEEPKYDAESVFANLKGIPKDPAEPDPEASQGS